MSAYSDKVIADGAVGYWRLNETSGTTASDSAGTKHATISGGVTLNQPGVVAGATAMLFPATGVGKVVPSAFPALGSAFTLEVWCKPSVAVVAINRMLMGKAIATDGEFQWYIATGSNVFRFHYYSGAYQTYNTSLITWTVDAWKHLVVTGGSGQLTLYVNGVAEMPSMAMTLAGAGGVHGIGCTTEVGAEAWGWQGGLSDVAVYPRALSAAEVAAHYTLMTAPATPSLPRDYNSVLAAFLPGTGDLTTEITAYLATLTGDMNNRWKQMEKNAGL